MSLEQVINDITEIQVLRIKGVPEWKIKEIANIMVSSWDWLF